MPKKRLSLAAGLVLVLAAFGFGPSAMADHKSGFRIGVVIGSPYYGPHVDRYYIDGYESGHWYAWDEPFHRHYWDAYYGGYDCHPAFMFGYRGWHRVRYEAVLCYDEFGDYFVVRNSWHELSYFSGGFWINFGGHRWHDHHWDWVAVQRWDRDRWRSHRHHDFARHRRPDHHYGDHWGQQKPNWKGPRRDIDRHQGEGQRGGQWTGNQDRRSHRRSHGNQQNVITPDRDQWRHGGNEHRAVDGRNHQREFNNQRNLSRQNNGQNNRQNNGQWQGRHEQGQAANSHGQRRVNAPQNQDRPRQDQWQGRRGGGSDVERQRGAGQRHGGHQAANAQHQRQFDGRGGGGRHGNGQWQRNNGGRHSDGERRR